MFAVILDAVGVICLMIDFMNPTIGEAISFICDLVGFFIFSIWSFFKGRGLGSLQTIKGRKNTVKRFLISFFGETLPFVGALPFWTIFVISEIKSNP